MSLMSNHMDKGSLIESLFLISLAAVGIREGIRLLGIPLLFRDIIGPGWYILVMSVLLLICAISYLLKNLKQPVITREGSLFSHLGPAGKVSVVFGLYIAVVSFIGYAISTFLFFIIILHASGEKSWIKCLVIGMAVALIFKLAFFNLAGIPLP